MNLYVCFPLLVLRVECTWLYGLLIIDYLFTLNTLQCVDDF